MYRLSFTILIFVFLISCSKSLETNCGRIPASVSGGCPAQTGEVENWTSDISNTISNHENELILLNKHARSYGHLAVDFIREDLTWETGLLTFDEIAAHCKATQSENIAKVFTEEFKTGHGYPNVTTEEFVDAMIETSCNRAAYIWESDDLEKLFDYLTGNVFRITEKVKEPFISYIEMTKGEALKIWDKAVETDIKLCARLYPRIAANITKRKRRDCIRVKSYPINSHIPVLEKWKELNPDAHETIVKGLEINLMKERRLRNDSAIDFIIPKEN